MRDSFFLSRQFVGFILIAVVIFISANAFNSHIESQCRASGGTIISRVDDFSMCMHK